jgi:hypothetical protein
MSPSLENVPRRLGLLLAAVVGVAAMIAAGTSITTTLAGANHRGVAGVTAPSPAAPAPAQSGGVPAADPTAELPAAAAMPARPPASPASTDKTAPATRAVGRLRVRPAQVSTPDSASPLLGEPAPHADAPPTEGHDSGD